MSQRLSSYISSSEASRLLREHPAPIQPHPGKPCGDRPVLWDLNPNVCGRCGVDINSHTHKPLERLYAPYEDAIWAWWVANAGVRDRFGLHAVQTLQVREHLQACAIDRKRTIFPYLGTVTEFAGTDASYDRIEMIKTSVYCACGAVLAREMVIENLSLGEIIWQVVKAGEVTS